MFWQLRHRYTNVDQSLPITRFETGVFFVKECFGRACEKLSISHNQEIPSSRHVPWKDLTILMQKYVLHFYSYITRGSFSFVDLILTYLVFPNGLVKSAAVFNQAKNIRYFTNEKKGKSRMMYMICWETAMPAFLSTPASFSYVSWPDIALMSMKK